MSGDRPQGLVPAWQWRAVRATDDRRQLCAGICWGLTAGGSTGGEEARPEFEEAFEENGLPEIMRSDNGSPFASPGVTGLTRLSAWWAKLGASATSGRHRASRNRMGVRSGSILTLLEATEPASSRPARPRPRASPNSGRITTTNGRMKLWGRRRRRGAMGSSPRPLPGVCRSRSILGEAVFVAGCARTARSNGRATSCS